jgi:hypothetical protein
MYIHFTNAVRTLLIPVAQPTVRARRLQDLGLFPPFTGSFGRRDDPLHVHMSYKFYIHFTDTCCPTHSLRALSIGSLGAWTLPLLAGLPRSHDDLPPCTYISQILCTLC